MEVLSNFKTERPEEREYWFIRCRYEGDNILFYRENPNGGLGEVSGGIHIDDVDSFIEQLIKAKEKLLEMKEIEDVPRSY
jgi:hypothetical protein